MVVVLEKLLYSGEYGAVFWNAGGSDFSICLHPFSPKGIDLPQGDILPGHLVDGQVKSRYLVLYGGFFLDRYSFFFNRQGG